MPEIASVTIEFDDGSTKEYPREYGKLVRDGIPALIREGGEEPYLTHVRSDELHDALAEKLIEEATEYAMERSIWELADVEGVIENILTLRSETRGTLDSYKSAKADRKGLFQHGTILKGVDDG